MIEVQRTSSTFETFDILILSPFYLMNHMHGWIVHKNINKMNLENRQSYADINKW